MFARSGAVLIVVVCAFAASMTVEQREPEGLGTAVAPCGPVKTGASSYSTKIGAFRIQGCAAK